MAVAASATFVVVVAASVAARVATIIASASAADMVDEALNLLVGGLAVFHDVAFEVEFFVGQRMVEVDFYFFFVYFEHFAKKALAVLVLKGKQGVNENVLVVEVAVDAKHVALQVNDAFGLGFSVGLFNGEGEVEFVAFLQANYLFFEFVESESESADKLKGFLVGGLFDKLECLFARSIELVSHGDVLVVVIFHIFVREFAFGLQRYKIILNISRDFGTLTHFCPQNLSLLTR